MFAGAWRGPRRANAEEGEAVGGDDLRIYSFSGSHRDVGRSHGETLRGELRESLRLRMERCVDASRRAGRELSQAAIRELAARHLPYVAEFSPGLMDEIEGIAEGADVTVEEVLIVGGYTDFVDVVCRSAAGNGFGCTAFFAGPAATSDGSSFVGQTWDMFSEAEEGVIALRLAVEGNPEVLALSYAGCVGMMGMNAEGLALAGNNLRPTDARPGVPWTFICREILRRADVESAFKAMARARLCSGHNFLFADRTGAAVSVETTGERLARIEPAGPIFVHANHYLDPGMRKLEAPPDPKGCSPHRARRLEQVLSERRGSLDIAYLQKALADHDGMPRSVCCHDYELSTGARIRTCAAIVMDIAGRKAHVAKGNPCKGGFRSLSLGAPHAS